MSQTLVIVESPTKAKTISRFLPKNYRVLACVGHIRDLPNSSAEIPEKFRGLPWANLGVNVEKDFEPIYVVPQQKKKVIDELKDELKKSETVLLATDEDREGESISWHLMEVLKPKVPIRRMVFHEITKKAIEEAIKSPREVDLNLVHAQEARRILDRLVGYSLSPLLWKKISRGLSAGRVQSVAVKLICERELERMKFKKAVYWDCLAQHDEQNIEFDSKLIEYQGKKIAQGKDFDDHTGQLKNKDLAWIDEKTANAIAGKIKGEKFKLKSLETKPLARRPQPPFITSTLQQEGSRKLGLSSRETMRVAQGLYENGWITYMRTDSTNLAKDAVEEIRKIIQEEFGKKYLPNSPRFYESKSKSAQEAHEAIRPAGQFVHPKATNLKGMELKLYELIWKRAIACQMSDAELKQSQMQFEVLDCTFQANGSTVEFPGFMKAYDDTESGSNAKDIILPNLKEGDRVTAKNVKSLMHETKPVARFTEASLVQTLEKLGIGRPSTYATIMSTIVDRGYVVKAQNALVPTIMGMVVTRFLTNYFADLVDTDFTSNMEDSLDDIASGKKKHIPYLHEIFSGNKGWLHKIKEKDKDIEPDDARGFKLESMNDVEIRVGRYGPYVQTVNNGEQIQASIPENIAPADLNQEIIKELIELKKKGNPPIAQHPKSKKNIYLMTGKYGPYVQLGEKDDEFIKRIAIPKGLEVKDVTVEKALFLLELPKVIGKDEGGKDITLGIGKYGPYVERNKEFRSVKGDVFEVKVEDAIKLFNEEAPKRGTRSKESKVLGKHPDGEEIKVMSGKYGPYVKMGKVNATIPKEKDPEKITLNEAVELINQRIQKL